VSHKKLKFKFEFSEYGFERVKAPVVKQVRCVISRPYFSLNAVIFTLKNSLKTFQSIDYPLIYAQQVVICFQHALEHTSTPPSRYCTEATGSDHETMTGNIIGLFTFVFTIDAGRENKLKHFLYYYILSL